MDEDKSTLIESALAALLCEDLGPCSVAELEGRIEKLQQEISRSETMIKAKKNLMGTAHDLFKS